MSYVDIANEESSDIQADGEDYYVALRNLENKYGYDEDIVTIIRMCNQWQIAFIKCKVAATNLLWQQLHMRHELNLY